MIHPFKRIHLIIIINKLQTLRINNFTNISNNRNNIHNNNNNNRLFKKKFHQIKVVACYRKIKINNNKFYSQKKIMIIIKTKGKMKVRKIRAVKEKQLANRICLVLQKVCSSSSSMFVTQFPVKKPQTIAATATTPIKRK